MRATWFPLLILLIVFAITSGTCLADSKRELAEIDSLCQCTGLQRKSGIQSRGGGGLISLLVAADGVTEKYWMRLLNDAPCEFGPDNYQIRYELPDVKDQKRRKFCIDRISV